ncbi:MAG: photosystem I protein PsaX [Leptolyngbyaceae cyanobacterium bins.59]|nr:photosystem I protein PsaX [Leptolyngbyaceae cyanobacterium bins.59]
MATQTKTPVHKGAVTKSSKPPYPFRTITALVLLAGNFLVAGIYFHVINPQFSKSH